MVKPVTQPLVGGFMPDFDQWEQMWLTETNFLVMTYEVSHDSKSHFVSDFCK